MDFRAAGSLCATSLFTNIKEILAMSNVDINKCLGQTYDGANVMSGKFNGVQAFTGSDSAFRAFLRFYTHDVL